MAPRAERHRLHPARRGPAGVRPAAAEAPSPAAHRTPLPPLLPHCFMDDGGQCTSPLPPKGGALSSSRHTRQSEQPRALPAAGGGGAVRPYSPGRSLQRHALSSPHSERENPRQHPQEPPVPQPCDSHPPLPQAAGGDPSLGATPLASQVSLLPQTLGTACGSWPRTGRTASLLLKGKCTSEDARPAEEVPATDWPQPEDTSADTVKTGVPGVWPQGRELSRQFQASECQAARVRQDVTQTQAGEERRTDPTPLPGYSVGHDVSTAQLLTPANKRATCLSTCCSVQTRSSFSLFKEIRCFQALELGALFEVTRVVCSRQAGAALHRGESPGYRGVHLPGMLLNAWFSGFKSSAPTSRAIHGGRGGYKYSVHLTQP